MANIVYILRAINSIVCCFYCQSKYQRSWRSIEWYTDLIGRFLSDIHLLVICREIITISFVSYLGILKDIIGKDPLSTDSSKNIGIFVDIVMVVGKMCSS